MNKGEVKREEKEFVVHFIEESYSSNDRELRTTDGGRRLIYKIRAYTAEDAYLEGVRRAKFDTQRSFRLNSCKVNPWRENDG